jgi:hypothetical protein
MGAFSMECLLGTLVPTPIRAFEMLQDENAVSFIKA